MRLMYPIRSFSKGRDLSLGTFIGERIASSSGGLSEFDCFLACFCQGNELGTAKSDVTAPAFDHRP
ncbi:MAG: hypothetical protein AB7U75_02125 [Hyphomicrobiaceae bacterium]